MFHSSFSRNHCHRRLMVSGAHAHRDRRWTSRYDPTHRTFVPQTSVVGTPHAGAGTCMHHTGLVNAGVA